MTDVMTVTPAEYTDPFDTPERRLLRQTCRRFAEREIVPYLDGWEWAGEVPRELHRDAAAAGLLGVGMPEHVGGCGGNIIDTCVVTEELILAGASSGLAAALFTHGIALPHIIESGDPYLIERFVRPTLTGDLIGALAVTEPDTGSDVARLRATAVRDGDIYIVNGAKTFITSGARADFVTLAVRTGGAGHAGVSLLVVERATRGFIVSRVLDKMGWRCSDTAELSLVDLRVPARNLVGAENSGFRQLMTHFVSERLLLATHAHAVAARALALTVEYTQTRSTFGQPLASRQVVQHRLVQMRQRVELARAYTRTVLARAAAGQEVVAEACLAKNAAVEACTFVVDAAVQLHGGTGYMRECEVERHYRDARVLGIGGGATEVLTDLVAKLSGYTA